MLLCVRYKLSRRTEANKRVKPQQTSPAVSLSSQGQQRPRQGASSRPTLIAQEVAGGRGEVAEGEAAANSRGKRSPGKQGRIGRTRAACWRISTPSTWDAGLELSWTQSGSRSPASALLPAAACLLRMTSASASPLPQSLTRQRLPPHLSWWLEPPAVWDASLSGSWCSEATESGP